MTPYGLASDAYDNLGCVFTECAFADNILIANNTLQNSLNILQITKIMAYSAPFDTLKFVMTIANNSVHRTTSDPEWISSAKDYPIAMNFTKDVVSTYGVVSGSELHIYNNFHSLYSRVNRPLTASDVFSSASTEGIVIYYYDNNYMGLNYKPKSNFQRIASESLVFDLDGRAIFSNNEITAIAAAGAYYYQRTLVDSGEYRFTPTLTSTGTVGTGSGDQIRVYVCELIGGTPPAAASGLANDAARLAEFLARIEDSNLKVLAVFESAAARLDGLVCYTGKPGPMKINVTNANATLYFCIESFGGSQIYLTGSTYKLEKA